MSKARNEDTNNRIRFAFGIIVLFAALIMARLFFLQVVSGSYYKTQAQRQQNFSQILTPRRGNIYMRERSGELMPVVSTKEGYLAYINPKKLQNPKAVYEKLSGIITLDEKDFFERASKPDDPYEVVARRFERDAARKIEELELAGVGIAPEEWRIYPAKTLASHVIGFLGYKNDELEGRYGIERFYENELRGREGYREADRSAGGILLELGRSLFSPPEEGKDIVLTLEPNVQAFLERKLSEIREKWQPARGGGIILEPKTGKILAMAVFPNFDPNNYGKTQDLKTFVNPLVENVFELGSVFKPLTMAAALNENAVTPETTYFDKGYLILDNYRIENFDQKGRGEVTMQKVLEESLNTGAAFAAEKLGKENMRKYFLNYGLDEKTGITLPGEVSGNLSNLYSKREVEYATASFGQGVAVTPLEFANAIAALANGGKLMRPYVVERIIRPGKEDVVIEPEVVREVIRPQTSETISKMLVKVANDALLGGTVKLKHWTAAAKTGTAQIPLENAKGYSEDFLHSFFAWAPGFDAKFLLFLYIEKPQGVKYASQSLSYFYKEIMQFLLTYYEVPPDR
ncbi:penicillin-binding protein 2 [Candidatus Giovannonibacteria bacterium]|nr:penicillin-binding protein 2 [Candidatus Giovannonibacteria bacterium]